MSSKSSSDGGLAPTFPDIQRAATRIAGVAHRTPVFSSREADRRAGARVFFKMENLQRGGSFKFRGAYNAASALGPAQRQAGIVAHSSGNHAQAVAYAARLLGISSIIVMPTDAPRSKIAATRSYGAEIVFCDRHDGDRQAVALDVARTSGRTLIPPFDHPDIIAGQGTVAAEFIEEVGTLDRLYVCVGGGGLIAGTALAVAALAPGCQVIGVEPESGDDARQSFESGTIVSIPTPHTIADGAQTRRIGDFVFPIMRAHVARMTTVSDDELRRQMQFFMERMKVVVEPTGCLAAAAALAESGGGRVGIVVSGGNVDRDTFSRCIADPAP
jgi:threonine dehydratase